MAPLLLLTGRPGVGKTTLLRRVADRLRPRRIGGFVTEEIRERGVRRGFRLTPFAGEARVMAGVGFPGPVRVGRYGVDVAAIDAVSEIALAADPAVELYLVDEIGKMECASERFVAAMGSLLDGERPVAATVAQCGGGLIAAVKRRPEAELWDVTPGNRDALVTRADPRASSDPSTPITPHTPDGGSMRSHARPPERNLRRIDEARIGRLHRSAAAGSTGSLPARKSSRYGKSS